MLTLSAEQKDLKSIYGGDNKYIIPEFQRPYSWGEEQVIQLYDDLTEAFDEGKDYFLGNIILAKSDYDKDTFYVIDGQQRIVTLWLLMKVLAMLMPSLKRLSELYSLKSWNDESYWPRVESNVIESSDSEKIREIFKWDDYRVLSLKKRNLRESNLYLVTSLLYRNFMEYFSRIGDEEKMNFFNFLIRNVSLLPIELGGKTIDEATAKALKIFETINNRGLDLCDADIFKAKLYKMADNAGEKGDFSHEWSLLVNGCEVVKTSLNDVFRYYSRIIRGQKYIVKSENSLREFYLSDDNSPFNGGNWRDIMRNLNSIVDILQWITYLSEQKSEVGTLCRILQCYSNKYPWSALVAFLYKHKQKEEVDDDFIKNQLKDFLLLLIKICYIEGSTTEVRIKIFDLIARLMNNRDYSRIQNKAFDVSLIGNPKGLRKGLVLLYFYLSTKETINVTGISLIKLFNRPDNNWIAEYVIDSKKEGSMGNYVLKDQDMSTIWDTQFMSCLLNNELYKEQLLEDYVLSPSEKVIDRREKDIQDKLQSFFSGNEES